MAAVDVAPVSLVPERRQRQSLEVIDVDLLDDDEILSSQRPLQRRRLSENPSSSSRIRSADAITILDSDEEPDQSSVIQHSPRFRRRGSRLHTHRRLVSPPPPAHDNTVPPVPTIPRRFAGLEPTPMRRRPPPFPPSVSGVVRPNERPFAFETNFRLPDSGDHPDERVWPPAAAAPSHHVPSMGLGGALISRHGQSATEEIGARQRHRERDRERHRQRGFPIFNFPSLSQAANHISNGVRHLSGAGFFDFRAERLEWLLDDADDLPGFLQPSSDASFTADLRQVYRGEPDYKLSFTHPRKPAPGFTFDFAPPSKSPSPTSSKSPIRVDDSPVAGSSKSAQGEASNLLVCADCLDPLVLGGGNDDESRKLWALRCGHLLDGKCVEKIMRPQVSASEDVSSKWQVVEQLRESNGTGESDCVGKGMELHEQIGKGKGREVVYSEPDTLSIRSRLRSRHSHAVSAGPTHNLRSRPAATPNQRRPGKKNKGKGKGKVKEPVVEDSFEWTCPVCAWVHVSLLIGGGWTMDGDRGAIGLFT